MRTNFSNSVRLHGVSIFCIASIIKQVRWETQLSVTKSIFGICISAVVLCGCASMFSGTTQPVQLNATINGQQVTDSYCTIQNGRGSWNAMAPDNVMVKRDANPLSISCMNQDKTLVGVTSVEPYYNTTNLWNIPLTFGFIITGVVGWVWDGVDGTTNEYPHTINVKMQQAQSLSKSIESSPQTKNESQPVSLTATKH